MKAFNAWRLRRAIEHRDKQPKYSPEWVEACARVQRALAKVLK